MSKDALGMIIRKLVTVPVETLGVVGDLLEKLVADPVSWVTATKAFLRKENPWKERQPKQGKMFVDFSADPHLPEGCNETNLYRHDRELGRLNVTVNEHGISLGGKWVGYFPPEVDTEWDENKEPYISFERAIERILAACEGQQLLNVNLLDWLLREENRHLIPPDWWGEHRTFFIGTVFGGYYRGGEWCQIPALVWDINGPRKELYSLEDIDFVGAATMEPDCVAVLRS